MFYRSLVLIVLFNYFFEVINCDENGHFFLKVSKSVPRIGKRGSKSNADFEKFFLKASKSVPRIGRRNEKPYDDSQEVAENVLSDNRITYPTWAELADRYEYDPELFSSPHYLANLEEEVGADTSLYGWDKVRLKRNIPARFQAQPI